MRVGPGVPLELDRLAGVDVDEVLAGLGALVARDVGRAEAGGLDEAEVLVQGVPAGRGGALALWVVEPDGVRAGREGSADPDAGDEAMGGDKLGQACREGEEGGDGSHGEGSRSFERSCGDGCQCVPLRSAGQNAASSKGSTRFIC